MMVSMVSTLVGLLVGGIVMIRVMEGPTDRYLTYREVQDILEAEKEA